MKNIIYPGNKMKCYVINLDRSPDRLSNMSRQLIELGIDFERVVAVDSAEVFHEGGLELLTASEIACFLSHQKCWLAISSGADDYGVVLEDDINLSSDAKYFLSTDAWIPKEAEIVKIETYNDRVYLSRFWKKTIRNRQIRKLSSWHTASAGYLLSKKRAVELLEISFGEIRFPVDFLLFDGVIGRLSEGKVYQMDPAICIQYDRTPSASVQFESTISHTGVVSNTFKKKKGETGRISREFNRIILGLLNIKKSIDFK